MVLVVYDEEGNRMEFETWQQLQDYFDNMEKERIKKNLKDRKSAFHIVKTSDPIILDFE